MPLKSYSCSGEYSRTPDIKAKQSKANALAWQNPKIRHKYLVAFANRPVNLNGVTAMHKALEEYRKDSEWMAKFSLSLQGHKSRYIIRDKVAFSKANEARSKKLRGRIFTVEHRKALSESRKRRGSIPPVSEETRQKMSMSHKKRCADPSNRLKKSRIATNLWQNPEYRDKVVKAVLAGLQVKPNRGELQLQDILNKHFPSEWEYNDGWLILAGKVPDFVNVNGRKQVIEYFGTYWHSPEKTAETEEDRINHFHKYGFDCIIIWEGESETTVVDKVRRLQSATFKI